MIIFARLLLAGGLALSALPVGAQEAPRPAATLAALSLDDLFMRLKNAKDETEASRIADLIDKRLSRSGSDTADLLMARAGQALTAEDAALSVELADRALALAPQWAEGWSRRALARFKLEDRDGAMADLRRALQNEPRHYMALVALGRLFQQDDEKREALASFRRALEIHPFLKEVKDRVSVLAREVEGQDL